MEVQSMLEFFVETVGIVVIAADRLLETLFSIGYSSLFLLNSLLKIRTEELLFFPAPPLKQKSQNSNRRSLISLRKRNEQCSSCFPTFHSFFAWLYE